MVRYLYLSLTHTHRQTDRQTDSGCRSSLYLSWNFCWAGKLGLGQTNWYLDHPKDLIYNCFKFLYPWTKKNRLESLIVRTNSSLPSHSRGKYSSYSKALKTLELDSLAERREALCLKKAMKNGKNTQTGLSWTRM